MSTNKSIERNDIKLKELTGRQKAALLLIALDVDVAAEVFKNLDPRDVELISAEITQVKNTPSKTVDEVLIEFHSMVTAR